MNILISELLNLRGDKMDFSDNYNNLLKQMNVNFESKKLTHKISKNASFLPFKVDLTRPFFENGFYNIFGEFSRILLDKKMKQDFVVNDIIQNIINDDNLDIEDGSEEYFTKLLKEYVFNEKNELKLLHPYLYLYVPLSPNKHSGGERELALFLRDIFCLENKNLVNFFKLNESNHAIINLILNKTPYLENFKTETKYLSKLNYVNDLFEADISFAIKNEKFFLDNMDNIFAFYYFFYISQLILKISKRLNYDDDTESLFYLLDWENVSKNRKTLNKGYRFLKDECNATPPRLNLISQLNILLGTEFYLETELLEFFNDLDYESQQEFLPVLKEWILNYRHIRKFEDTYSPEDLPDDYEQLADLLLSSLNDKKKGVSGKAINLFMLNMEEVAKHYFLKRRGSYGHVLNINRDMLLMITALCVKDKKIKLNQLFKEYEKRGIFFDKYSKEEVVNFLTKLNLIDKKSDSGDAQYVKPVL